MLIHVQGSILTLRQKLCICQNTSSVIFIYIIIMRLVSVCVNIGFDYKDLFPFLTRSPLIAQKSQRSAVVVLLVKAYVTTQLRCYISYNISRGLTSNLYPQSYLKHHCHRFVNICFKMVKLKLNSCVFTGFLFCFINRTYLLVKPDTRLWVQFPCGFLYQYVTISEN